LLRKLVLAVFVAVVLFCCGCSLFPKKAKPEELLCILTIDKMTYLSNEPVLATVRVQNLTNEEISLLNLDARTVSFYRLNESTGEPLEVMPVYSEKEPMSTVAKLKGLEGMERPFLFTTLTKGEGDYLLQAFFHSSPFHGKKARPTVISEAKKLSIAGRAPYERDAKGILMKEDAIRIAKEKVGDSAEFTTATLIINEAGLYDWWVTLVLNKKDAQGQPIRKAYFINPYLAAIRKEANPWLAPPRWKESQPAVMFKRDAMNESNIPLPATPNVKK